MIGAAVSVMLGVVPIIVGVAAIFKARGWRKGDDVAADTGTSVVRELGSGTVRVRGTAQPTGNGGSVRGPMTGREGLAVSVAARERVGTRWETTVERRVVVSLHAKVHCSGGLE